MNKRQSLPSHFITIHYHLVHFRLVRAYNPHLNESEHFTDLDLDICNKVKELNRMTS